MANELRRSELMYKQKLERGNTDLKMAESEVITYAKLLLWHAKITYFEFTTYLLCTIIGIIKSRACLNLRNPFRVLVIFFIEYTSLFQVDLLGDEVDALLRLLEKIYIALDHYSPVLKHYPGVSQINPFLFSI